MTFKHKHIGKALARLFFLFALVFSPAAVLAQVKFTTQVSEKQIAENQYLQVEYTIENAKSVDVFRFPNFKHFRVIQGPVQSSGMSVTNGVMTQYKGMSFVLQPMKTGKLVVPGATAMIDGKMMRSSQVTLEVIAGAGNTTPATPLPPSAVWPDVRPQVNEEYTIAPGENIADKVKNNLMVVAHVNKTTCFEGEPIIANYKLYSRLRSESRVVKRPSLNGFSVFDMVNPDNNNPSVETLNGKTYNVHIIRKTQLFPLQPGTFVLDPVELENKVRFIKSNTKKNGRKNSLKDFLDEFMSDDGGEEIEEHTFNLGSKPVTVVVKPLPTENRPTNFNGAVGNFKVRSGWKNRVISAGDAIELSVTIRGQGNFTVVNPPVLNLPPGIDSYDPVIKEEVDKSIYPLKGVKTFNYTLVARDTGNFNIPPVSFSYFDPGKAEYKTEKTDSFFLHIIPSVNKVKAREGDEIKTITPAYRGDFPLKSLLAVIAAFIIAGLIFYQYKISSKQKIAERKKTVSPASRAAGTPSAKVLQPVVDPLEQARWALQTGESQRFYREINKAAWKMVSDTLQLPATALNKTNAISTLKLKGVKGSVIENFQTVLNACELALYTPVHDMHDMQQTLEKAEALITDLKLSFS